MSYSESCAFVKRIQSMIVSSASFMFPRLQCAQQ
jgi:hypothetical protein